MKTFLNANPQELHFMVDIETLALTPDAAITEIGCVTMEYYAGGFCSTTQFHSPVIDPAGEKNNNTLQWRLENNLPWLTEKEVETQAALEIYSLPLVLEKFFEWILDTCDEYNPESKPVMWCKGTDFDCTILRTAVARRAPHLKAPWVYNKFHDMRTLTAIFPQFAVDKTLLKHNGLDDALMQATALINIAKHIAQLEIDSKHLKEQRHYGKA